MQKSPLFLGIEIGGTKLQVVAGTDGAVHSRWRFTLEAGSDASAIRQLLQSGIGELMAKDNIEGVGVGFGGPVDHQRGIICTSHQVGGWNDFNLAEWMHKMTGKPVVIENDANTAALAEAVHGAGKGHHTVFYMTIGSGIGGGLVQDRSIYHGRMPGEVEIGHLRLNKEGHTLEDRCSGWAVNKKVKDVITQHPGSVLGALSADHTGPEAALLAPALQAGDATSRAIVLEVADDLAFALSHVVHLFHPDIIIIGGGLSHLGEQLLQPLQAQLSRYVMKAFLPLPMISLAALEEDVVPIGAVQLAQQNFLRSSS